MNSPVMRSPLTVAVPVSRPELSRNVVCEPLVVAVLDGIAMGGFFTVAPNQAKVLQRELAASRIEQASPRRPDEPPPVPPVDTTEPPAPPTNIEPPANDGTDAVVVDVQPLVAAPRQRHDDGDQRRQQQRGDDGGAALGRRETGMADERHGRRVKRRT